MPPVRNDLYEQVIAKFNPHGGAGQEPGDPIVTDRPATWDGIKPGQLVLTHESLIYGWWEAVVVERMGDKVTLRMRDYPSYGKFTVPVTAVALISPVGS